MMNSNPWPMIEFGRAWTAPYENLVWFGLWQLWREHRLNADALAAWWQRMALTQWQGMYPVPSEAPGRACRP